MNMISKKSTIMSFVFAGLVASCVPTTSQAVMSDNQKKLTFFALACLFITNCKEAIANPEKATWEDGKKAFQIQNIFTQEYWENIAHLINDGLFGQAGIRGKAVLGIVSEEDGTMMWKTVQSLPSTGICGHTLYGLKLAGKKFNDLTKTMGVPFLAYLWYNGTEFDVSPASDGVKVTPRNGNRNN
jgi:hypothetical protein